MSSRFPTSNGCRANYTVSSGFTLNLKICASCLCVQIWLHYEIRSTQLECSFPVACLMPVLPSGLVWWKIWEGRNQHIYIHCATAANGVWLLLLLFFYIFLFLQFHILEHSMGLRLTFNSSELILNCKCFTLMIWISYANARCWRRIFTVSSFIWSQSST